MGFLMLFGFAIVALGGLLLVGGGATAAWYFWPRPAKSPAKPPLVEIIRKEDKKEEPRQTETKKTDAKELPKAELPKKELPKEEPPQKPAGKPVRDPMIGP